MDIKLVLIAIPKEIQAALLQPQVSYAHAVWLPGLWRREFGVFIPRLPAQVEQLQVIRVKIGGIENGRVQVIQRLIPAQVDEELGGQTGSISDLEREGLRSSCSLDRRRDQEDQPEEFATERPQLPHCHHGRFSIY